VIEYDTPYNLLQAHNSVFSSMVERTGPLESVRLKRIVRLKRTFNWIIYLCTKNYLIIMSIRSTSSWNYFQHLIVLIAKIYLSNNLPFVWRNYSFAARVIVTWSDKMGLLAHLQVLRCNGFEFWKCCSSLMKAVTCVRFSHYFNQLLTFNIIQSTRNQLQSFPPF